MIEVHLFCRSSLSLRVHSLRPIGRAVHNASIHHGAGLGAARGAVPPRPTPTTLHGGSELVINGSHEQSPIRGHYLQHYQLCVMFYDTSTGSLVRDQAHLCSSILVPLVQLGIHHFLA